MRSRFVRSFSEAIELDPRADRAEGPGGTGRGARERARGVPSACGRGDRAHCREGPDVGVAGEGQDHRGERDDRRESDPSPAAALLEREPEQQAAGDHREAREGHPVGERRLDPVLEIVSAVSELPEADEGQHDRVRGEREEDDPGLARLVQKVHGDREQEEKRDSRQMPDARGRIAREESRKRRQEGEEAGHGHDRRRQGRRPTPPPAHLQQPGGREDAEGEVGGRDLRGEEREENEEREQESPECHSFRFPIPDSRFPARVIRPPSRGGPLPRA